MELQPLVKTKSGVGWYTYNIIKYLCRENIDLQGNVFNFLGRNNIEDILKEFNFNIETCRFLPYSVYTRVWNYLPIKYNSLFKNKADIYHFFNFIVPPKVDGKVIVTVYDMVYKVFPETMYNSNYRRLEKNLRYSVDRADTIITISESSKREIIKYLNVDPNKIEIVPPGIEMEAYNRQFDKDKLMQVKDKYNLPEEFMLYLGTLEPRKNIESIIDAFSLYKKSNRDSIKLVIAGSKGWMYESIFEKVKSFNIEDQVIFIGYVDENDKPYVYEMSTIFIFPSLYEGFGMPVLEAMASKVPVITSDISSLKEVCGDAALFVNPKDLDAICDDITKLRQNPNIGKQLIEKGLTRCKNFTWEKSAAKLINIYEKLSR